jgi:hypothetical protein
MVYLFYEIFSQAHLKIIRVIITFISIKIKTSMKIYKMEVSIVI